MRARRGGILDSRMVFPLVAAVAVGLVVGGIPLLTVLRSSFARRAAIGRISAPH